MVREFGQTRKERSQEKEGRCECTQCVYSVGTRQITGSVKSNLHMPDAALGTEERVTDQPSGIHVVTDLRMPRGEEGTSKYIYLQTHTFSICLHISKHM